MSSYKKGMSYIRRNEVIKHAHAKQSSNIESSKYHATKSMDSDLNKLQQQLIGYQRRRSTCSTSSISGNSITSDDGSIKSAPDARPISSSAERSHTAQNKKSVRSRSSHSATQPLPLVISPVVQGELNNRLSVSNGSLSPPPPDLNLQRPRFSRRLSKSATNLNRTQQTPPRLLSPTPNKHKVARQRSKSLDMGINTIDDITSFFNQLKQPGRRDEVKIKRHSLPVITTSKAARHRQLPELIVTCEEE